jgi:hypothetical protein
LTIGTEGNGPDPIGMTLQSFVALPGADIPQSHSLVNTAARDCSAIRTESNGPDPIGMTLQSFAALPNADIPQSHGLIVTATS